MRGLIIEKMDLLAGMLVTLLVSAPVSDSAAVYLGAWSQHLGDDWDYNSRHEMVAVESGGWIAGTYENSYYDRTQLVGYGWDVAEVEDWRLRLYTGATYGYRDCWGDQDSDGAELCPALVPELSYTRYPLQPAVMLFGDAVAVAVKFEF